LVGNGSTLAVEGFIKVLEVTIQSHSLMLRVYLLPISGVDLVLCASWLATLGAHISNYSTLTLKFLLNGQFVTLHGDHIKLSTQAQFHHLKRMHTTNSIAEMYSLHIQFPRVL